MLRRVLFALCLLPCAAAAQSPLALAGTAPKSHAGPAQSSSWSAEAFVAAAAAPDPRTISQRCAEHAASGDECKLHWRGALVQTGRYLAAQDFGLIAFDHWSRDATFHGNWFAKYSDSLHAARFGHWNDGDPALVNYVGHPMQGATVGFLYIQNDPKGMTLRLSKSKAYWFSRLRATAWAAAYEAQWELGPIGEAGIGFEGRTMYVSKTTGGWTDGAGLTDFVATPVGGLAWMVAEDALDRTVIRRLEKKTSNPLLRLAISALNPNRSIANMMRFKTPWHRDDRSSGMAGFWANR